MKYELEITDELKSDLKIVLGDKIENCKHARRSQQLRILTERVGVI